MEASKHQTQRPIIGSLSRLGLAYSCKARFTAGVSAPGLSEEEVRLRLAWLAVV